MSSPTPLRLPPAEKLEVLRCLDRYRNWQALDDRRFCLSCGKTITGRQIEIMLERGGSGLRASCPTENCASIPMDWALPGSKRTALPPAPRPETAGAGEVPKQRDVKHAAEATTAKVIRGALRALRART